MKTYERASIPALVSIVPKTLVPLLSYGGWKERVQYEHFAKGFSDEVLRAAFDTWRRGGRCPPKL